jgi:hypothetical protein
VDLSATGGGGVTSLAAGSGISVSSSTGAVTVGNTGVLSLGGYTGSLSLGAGSGISVSGLTIANTGVTSLGGYTGSLNLSGGTGVSVSGLTVSIGQAVGTGSAVTFAGATITGGVQINQSSGYGLYLPYSYVYADGLNSFNSTWNGLQASSGGVSSSMGYYLSGGSQVINSSGQFVGTGVVTAGGVGGAGFNPTGYTGGSWTLYFSGGFTIGGSTYHTVVFVGGAIVSVS